MEKDGQSRKIFLLLLDSPNARSNKNVGQVKARNQELILDPSCRWQGPQSLSRRLLPLLVHIRKQQKMETGLGLQSRQLI